MWQRDAPMMNIYREALKIHFERNFESKVIVHTEWKNCFDEEFAKFLNLKNPSFVILHGGDDQALSHVSMASNILWYIVLGNRQDVVEVSSVEMRSSKMWSGHYQHNKDHKEFLKMYRKKLFDAWVSLTDVCRSQSDMTDEKEMTIKDIFEESKTQFYFAILVRVKNALLSTSNGKKCHVSSVLSNLALVFAAMTYLSLPDRIEVAASMRGLTSDLEATLFGTDKMQALDLNNDNVLKAIILCIERAVIGYPESAAADFMVDIFDINVFNLYFNKQKHVVSKDIYDVWHQMVSSLSLDPSHEKCVKVSLEDPQDEKDKPKLNYLKENKLAPVWNDLIEDYTSDIRSQLSFSDAKDVENFATDNDFDESYHWHSGKPLVDDLDRDPQKSDLSSNRWVRSRQLRRIQQFENFLSLYAESLQGDLKPELITKPDKNANKSKIHHS